MMGGALDILGTGGPVLIILLLLSLLSLALIGVKMAQLWPCGSGVKQRADAFVMWQKGQQSGAIDLLRPANAPASRLLHDAMTARGTLSEPDFLEAELLRRGNEAIGQLSKGISKLELVAMISPLLGLLGTVLGMIQAFQELELAAGAANAAVLAGGIWQALLTTAAGLLVALPAAIAASLMRARIDAEAQRIESAVGQFLLSERANGLKT